MRVFSNACLCPASNDDFDFLDKQKYFPEGTIPFKEEPNLRIHNHTGHWLSIKVYPQHDPIFEGWYLDRNKSIFNDTIKKIELPESAITKLYLPSGKYNIVLSGGLLGIDELDITISDSIKNIEVYPWGATVDELNPISDSPFGPNPFYRSIAKPR